MNEDVTLFGADYSVYVRIVQLALKEKGIPYRFVEVDIFGTDDPPTDYLERHPFGRIPAFEHNGFRLFETVAITRYIDDAFNGPPLMPEEARKRARVAQIIGVLDSYAYRSMVWDVFVERVDVLREGGISDEEKITAGLETAEICLTTLAKLMGEYEYLTGPNITLADLHAAPIFIYFCETTEGSEMLARHPAIARWWGRLSQHPNVQAFTIQT